MKTKRQPLHPKAYILLIPGSSFKYHTVKGLLIVGTNFHGLGKNDQFVDS